MKGLYREFIRKNSLLDSPEAHKLYMDYAKLKQKQESDMECQKDTVKSKAKSK